MGTLVRASNVAARESFAVWFSGQLRQRHWSQPRAADVIGVTDTCIRKWQHGDTRPAHPEEYFQIAAAFSLPALIVLQEAAGGPDAADAIFGEVVERRAKPYSPQKVANRALISAKMRENHARGRAIEQGERE